MISPRPTDSPTILYPLLGSRVTHCLTNSVGDHPIGDHGLPLVRVARVVYSKPIEEEEEATGELREVRTRRDQNI
jgi:hypothetical protein